MEEVESVMEEGKEEELSLLREYLDECIKKNEWKEDLRSRNGDCKSRPEENDLRKLDSSLKRNTAFIRKLKNYTESQRQGILKEISTLNLTKYIGEVSSALLEAKFKMNDLQGVVDICSLLHQTYSEFSPSFLEAWTRALSIKKSIPNPVKLRVDLRLYAELISTRVFSLKEGLPLLGNVLTSLINMGKDTHAHISIILSFCKHCGTDYAALLPRKIRIISEKHGISIQAASSNLLPPSKQQNVKQMLKEYFSSVVTHLLKDRSDLRSLESNNRRILLTKGEVHSERLQKAEKATSDYGKLLLNAESLANILDEDLPSLGVIGGDSESLGEGVSSEDGKILEGEILKGGGSGCKGDGNDLWEDEDTRSFYEDLIDLKALIPAILYKDVASKEEEIELSSEELGSLDDLDDGPPVVDLEDDVEEENSSSSSSVRVSSSCSKNKNKTTLSSFLANIPNCINREMIDKAALEFSMDLNTKKNRLKLVKTLFGVHRNRQDLFPFYARLVATLGPVMPEVKLGLGQYLKHEFRWQLRKKDQMKIESKLKVVRFIGELVKFQSFPKSEALHCLKQLIFDFSHHHIEMACTLMETAGRYLYRMPESHQRTKIYLEQMMRKKQAVMSSDSRYSMMIENAFYTVCPPENVGLNTAVRLPPLHAYIRKLLFNDFNESNASRVLKQIRKINWIAKEDADYAIQCLSQVWNLKFYNIRNFAGLLAGLVSYHDWIAPRIIDGVLENIRSGMELNDSKYNQRRLAVITFLGELYVFQLIDSSVIFKVLYSLITFGSGDPLLDPPTHTFRLRLVCSLLDTCGPYFTSQGSKKKLSYYLAYFQRYYWLKRAFVESSSEAFPFFIKNLIVETLPSVLPGRKVLLFESLDEAVEAVEGIEREMMSVLREKAPEFVKEFIPGSESGGGGGGLDVIAEEEEGGIKEGSSREASSKGLGLLLEEDEEEEEEDFDEDREDEEELSLGGDLDEEDDDIEDEEDYDDFEDHSGVPEDMSQDEEDEEEGLEDEYIDEDEEDEDNNHEKYDLKDDESSSLPITGKPELVKCEEDDDFVNMFDKMLNDNINENRSSKAQPLNLTVPLHMNSNRFKSFDPSKPPSEEIEDEKTIQFSMLLRKPTGGSSHNKHFYRQLDVPIDSELARNLQRQEEAARREKEKVKQLTLQINERQEEEDMNELIDSMSKLKESNHFPHRRGHKFSHQKGAPDAMSIFGSKR
eukprot:TRINITY_DN3548_c0_g1_i3.p1 TRINITY_DN3548_c0_g1~~TRINITY_DN3548_c0_g1_i3.p1  ORF type:complete len:1212 (-),score=455.06 TRINITY_DN3548_c0_g1_i3:427-4062(-)